MSDENNDTKETKLDKLCSIAWAYAGLAFGTLMVVLTVINACVWWWP